MTLYFLIFVDNLHSLVLHEFVAAAFVDTLQSQCQVQETLLRSIPNGEEAEFPEVEEPSGSRPGAAAMKKYEMDYKRRLEKQETYMKEKCKAVGIIMGQCLELTKEAVKSDKSFKSWKERTTLKDCLDYYVICVLVQTGRDMFGGFSKPSSGGQSR